MQELCNLDGSLWGPGLKLYSNLKAPESPELPQEGFYQYVPVLRQPPIPTAEGLFQAAVEARRQRILEKKCGRRRLRARRIRA